MSTGWSWEYVWDTMTLYRLGIMSRVWKRSPPPHVNLSRITALLKAFMGVKDEPETITQPQRMQECSSLPEIEE